MAKSKITVAQTADLNAVGRSYYIFCLEQALANIKQARALVKGDVTDSNHELSTIQASIEDAIVAS